MLKPRPTYILKTSQMQNINWYIKRDQIFFAWYSALFISLKGSDHAWRCPFSLIRNEPTVSLKTSWYFYFYSSGFIPILKQFLENLHSYVTTRGLWGQIRKGYNMVKKGELLTWEQKLGFSQITLMVNLIQCYFVKYIVHRITLFL